jgi:hypothetical protein
MSFYSIYLIEGSVELRTLEQERVAIAGQGRLISTQKNYQSAKEIGITLAKEKNLLFVDFTILKPS